MNAAQKPLASRKRALHVQTCHYLTNRVRQTAVNLADWTMHEMLNELIAYGFAEPTVDVDDFYSKVLFPLIRSQEIAVVGGRDVAPPCDHLPPDQQPAPLCVFRLAQRGARQ